MGLRHAVITSVDRDDLPDLGASAFVGVIRSIRRMAPGCKVEVLTPDFRGEEMPLARVIAERPDVFNHNVETVPRLYPLARRGSRFLRSCRVLRNAKEMGGDEVVTKSGPDDRARRVEGGAARDLRRAARARRPGAHRRASTCARRATTCRWCATGTRTSSRSSSARRTRWASSRWRRGRSCARATTPSRRWPRRRRRARGYLPARPVIPLKDDIPTRRFPIDDVALIVINVIVYFVFEHGGSGAWASRATSAWSSTGRSRYEITHPGTECVSRSTGGPARASRGDGQPRPARRPSGSRSSPRCSCTAACSTSAGNMLFLWIFGNNIEDSMSRLRFVGFYLLGGPGGAGAPGGRWTRTRRCRPWAPAGRSPAVLGAYARALSARAGGHADLHHHLLHGRHIAGAARTRVVVPAPAACRAFSEPARAAGGGVAYFAHIGGFLFGLLAIKLFANNVQRGLRPGAPYPRVLMGRTLALVGSW